MREVVIVSAARTPIGSFGGSLKDVPARTLGAVAAKAAIERAGIQPDMIDEVVSMIPDRSGEDQQEDL